MLQAKNCRLVPLTTDHLSGLLEVTKSLPDATWQHLAQKLNSQEELEVWLNRHLAQHREGCRIPFTIINSADNQIIGSTSFLGMDQINRQVEIGWTFVAHEFWGTAINSQCKLALLNHAFNDMSCVRVYFKTGHHNFRSRGALEKIGARYEGTFRKHMLMSNGSWRDSAYYSFIDVEWPKQNRKLDLLANGPSQRRDATWVRALKSDDAHHIPEYFHSQDDSNLERMGITRSKLPALRQWERLIQEDLLRPDPEKKFCYLIWEGDDGLIGHCNINQIRYGQDATIHLHIWHPQKRQQGIGQKLFSASVDYFQQRFFLQCLHCEPKADNLAPNRTLLKLGFEFSGSLKTTPGWINSLQTVNQYVHNF